MVQPQPQPQLTRRGPGHLVLAREGRLHDVTFPAEGNLEQIVLKVLSGAEYPTLRLPGWEPRTILDVGANVGASAIFFALAYPGARIRCWEPSARTAAHLRRNTAWLPGVEVQQLGLSDAPAALRLYSGTTQCAQASVRLSVETRPDAFEEIALVSAREAVGSVEGPAILKLDTEGCEVPILQDLGPLLDQIDVLYVEYHSERDRRAIDALLGDRFSLWKSSARAVHRGTVAYLHARVLAGWPRLGALEISAA